MKKLSHRLLGLISVLALTIATFSNALASYKPAESAVIYKYLSPTDATGLILEKSGTVEKITTTADGWMMQAGGDVASTHYARIKYKLPEAAGVVFTNFYAKAVIVLPADFYAQQKAGFRILNTDNYPTTLNGASVGAANANELRVSVYMNSDQKLRVLVDHETGVKQTLYTAPAILPTGEHTFELAGDVANVAPWYFKIDGIVVASGTQRLSTDDMTNPERVVTRIVAGIDGAADQDANSMNLLVKSLEIANYDMSGGVAAIPPTVAPTSTTIAATPFPAATNTPAATSTQIPFTATASPLPTQPATTNTAIPLPTKSVVDIRVASGNDDVEENSSGKMTLNSGDLELIYDGSTQIVGIRFKGVQIPKGATITNAYIQFKSDEISNQKVNLIFSGEASANAPAFTSTARNISMRAKTSNKVNWAPSPWLKVGAMESSQRTPNLNFIVQEIVNQPNWASGNSLVMIITGSGGKQVAVSFEGSASGAPLLHIEFSMPVPAVP